MQHFPDAIQAFNLVTSSNDGTYRLIAKIEYISDFEEKIKIKVASIGSPSYKDSLIN
jgi:hypothetical protein